MNIKVLYFAQLADLAGKSEEEREIDHSSPGELYREVREDYRFPHDFRQIQVAVNDRLSSHGTSLQEGDRIAFLPPMTGG